MSDAIDPELQAALRKCKSDLADATRVADEAATAHRVAKKRVTELKKLFDRIANEIADPVDAEFGTAAPVPVSATDPEPDLAAMRERVRAEQARPSVPAAEVLGALVAAADVPTWRAKSLQDLGWDEEWPAHVRHPISVAVWTAGELADELLKGNMFGLELSELQQVYACVEMVSEDDEHPISFERHFNPEPERKPSATVRLDANEHLRKALHRIQGAAGRWAKHKRNGLSDAALLAAIGEEFGGGGAAGPGYNYHCRGGKEPALWIGDKVSSAKPTLAGARLRDAVRALLSIPTMAAVIVANLPKPKRDRKKKPQPKVLWSGSAETWDGVPGVPSEAITYLRANHVLTVADLDEIVNKLKRERRGATVTRSDALRYLNLPANVTNVMGDALIDHFQVDDRVTVLPEKKSSPKKRKAGAA